MRKVINVLKVKQVVLRFKASVTVADVENVVTGGAYEKPRQAVVLLLEHRVEAVFVAAGGTYLKLTFYGDLLDGVIHGGPPCCDGVRVKRGGSGLLYFKAEAVPFSPDEFTQ